MLKDTNYVTIQGWMINRLNLSGNKLILFALIYGFSQDQESKFDGSLSYIEETIKTTRATVIKLLDELVEENLIFRNSFKDSKNQNRNSYKINDELLGSIITIPPNAIGSLKTILPPSIEIIPRGSIEIIPNNTNSNNSNINNTNEEKNIKKEIAKKIIEYLNEKLGTSYRTNNETTISHINARLNEKRTFEDFKTVIDKKYNAWKGTEWEKFLRPETLFGTKFETYLNEKCFVKQEIKPQFRSFTSK